MDISPLPTLDSGILDVENLPKLQIHFQVELPSLPCPFVDVGVMDSFKKLELDSYSEVNLIPMYQNGTKIHRKKKHTIQIPNCGSCYGAASGCCNTCKDVKRAFKAKGKAPPPLSTIEQCKDEISDFSVDERCFVSATVTVPPSSGFIYIAPGNSYSEHTTHVADYLAMNMTLDDFNLTHTLRRFTIGNNLFSAFLSQGRDLVLKGSLLKSSLNQEKNVIQEKKGRMKSLYFIRATKQKRYKMNYYTLNTEHYDRYREGASEKFPGIFFYYSISPIVVEFKRDVSFLHFLVDLMAIVGGVFSLATLLHHILQKSTLSKLKESF